MKKNTFTLIEILAVIAIIGVLAGLTVGTTGIIMRKSADAKTEAAIKNVEIALERFKKECGFYPPSVSAGLSVFRFEKNPTAGSDKETLSSKFDEKFRNANTKEITISGTVYLYVVDGNGNPMVYRCPGYFNKGKYDFGSVGRDLKFGDNQGDDVTLNTSTGVLSPDTKYTSDFGKGDDVVNFSNNEQ